MPHSHVFSSSLDAGGWGELAALTALTALNINAWGDAVRMRGGGRADGEAWCAWWGELYSLLLHIRMGE